MASNRSPSISPRAKGHAGVTAYFFVCYFQNRRCFLCMASNRCPQYSALHQRSCRRYSEFFALLLSEPLISPLYGFESLPQHSAPRQRSCRRYSEFFALLLSEPLISPLYGFESLPQYSAPRQMQPGCKVHKKAPPGFLLGGADWLCNYAITLDTTPEPTVRPPSRIAKRRPCSMAIGVIRVISMVIWSPGITISTPSGSLMLPVTSVVRK